MAKTSKFTNQWLRAFNVSAQSNLTNTLAEVRKFRDKLIQELDAAKTARAQGAATKGRAIALGIKVAVLTQDLLAVDTWISTRTQAAEYSQRLQFNPNPPTVRNASAWYRNGEWHVDLPDQHVTHVVSTSDDAIKLVREWDAKTSKRQGKSIVTLLTWHDIPLNFEPPK